MHVGSRYQSQKPVKLCKRNLHEPYALITEQFTAEGQTNLNSLHCEDAVVNLLYMVLRNIKIQLTQLILDCFPGD